MKTRSTLIILSITMIFMGGCTGSKLMVDFPTSDQYTLYAWGLSTGIGREEFSVKNAGINARQELAATIETHVKALTKGAFEQVGIGKDKETSQLFSDAVKATVNQTLNFSMIYDGPKTKSNPKKRGGGFRTEVTYKVEIGPVNEAMLDNIKQHKLLYERFRASSLFKELENEIDNNSSSTSSE